MDANEQVGQQAAELERQATQTEDPATAAQKWQQAQDARFGEEK